MTDLSPAARAVMDAWWNDSKSNRSGIAAALRAAAQTLAYKIHCFDEGWHELLVDAKDLYAIADELEGGHD